MNTDTKTQTHTPGPWHVNDETGWISAGRYAHRNVCLIADDLGDSDEREQGLANARLIAAAPDLLKALEAITQHTDADKDMSAILEDIREIAGAAINLATR